MKAHVGSVLVSPKVLTPELQSGSADEQTTSYEQAYARVKCSVCGKSSVRLYRPYGNFYRPEDNVCNKDLPNGKTDWMVPLRLDKDGGVWGYTSGDQESVEAFLTLPEASDKHPTWLREPLITDGRPSMWGQPKGA